MSEIIERVARAIAGSFSEPDLLWEKWTSQAATAIAAMREPTEAMLKAKVAEEDAGLPVDTVEGYLDYWNAGAVWRAMVDEALK